MSGVWGISLVKDEADVIEHTIRHMLEEVDAVLIADNGSTDGTREILADFADQYPRTFRVVDDPEVGYYQARKMTWLAAQAAEWHATWVVPFDADEWWSTPWGRIADVLANLPYIEVIATATLYDHVASGIDPETGSPFQRIAWRRREPARLPKVAARATVPVNIEQGNHSAWFATSTTPTPVLTVDHFPYRSPTQMARKARNGASAYAATDLPDDVGAHWRQYGALIDAHGEEAIHDVFATHFFVDDPRSDQRYEHAPVA